MYHSGYWSDTLEGDVKVKVARTDESERKNVAGVKFFAPIMETHANPEKEGPRRVWFGVFEHTCSQHGVYRLEMTPELQDITLSVTRYSQGSEVAKFETVEGAIRYVRERYWYGDGPEDDEDA
jgi:hypothetical protein